MRVFGVTPRRAKPSLKPSTSSDPRRIALCPGGGSAHLVWRACEGKIMTFEQALEAFRAEFPGWWWSAGECHVSCDASMAPDRYGPDDVLLRYGLFDEGFHVHLRQ